MTISKYMTGRLTEEHTFQTGVDNVPAISITAVYTDQDTPDHLRIRQHSTSGVVRIPVELLDDIGALLQRLAAGDHP